MSPTNREIYLRHSTKELETLESWTGQLRGRNDRLADRYAAELERQAGDVRKSMSIAKAA